MFPVPTERYLDVVKFLAAGRPSSQPSSPTAPEVHRPEEWDEESLRDLWMDCGRVPERRALLLELAKRGPRGATTPDVAEIVGVSVPGFLGAWSRLCRGTRFGRDLPFANMWPPTGGSLFVMPEHIAAIILKIANE
jgi:hypothetical protein